MLSQFLLLLLGGSIFQIVISEVPNFPSSDELIQSFKQNIREIGKQVTVPDKLNSGSADVVTSSKTNWVVSSGFSDSSCSTLSTSQGFRTDCLKDAAKTSIRVTCNSTTITLDEFSSSTTCSGKISSRTVAKTSSCITTRFAGEKISYSCITSPNDPPLPTGDWFSFISYADSTCNQKNLFYGWKNDVCMNSFGSSSMKFSYPTLYSYSSSATCSGPSSTTDLTSLTTQCNKNYAGSSSHYYFLHSDGSTVLTATPTVQPTLRPSTKSTKPTVKIASNPSFKPTASKPATTGKPTVKTTIKPTAKKPTLKPTTKNMVTDPSGGGSSSDVDLSPESVKPHHNDSSAAMVTLSVCLGVFVIVLLLWHCCRREHHEHESKYTPLNRKEERGDKIEDIPEAL